MTILPGSLDHLYYGGIIDHIPYEAYEYGPAMPYSGMINPYSGLKQAITGVGYLNTAKRGLLYDTYTSNDTFVRRDMSGFGASTGGNYSIRDNAYGANSGFGNGYNVAVNSYGEQGASFIDSIRNAASKTKDSVLNASSSSIWKGLAAAALIIATPILMFKCRKKPSAEVAEAVTKPGFLTRCKEWFSNLGSKINPKNWFKK